jgi:hypothetical protein
MGAFVILKVMLYPCGGPCPMWWVIVMAVVFAHVVVLSWLWLSPQSFGGGLHVSCKQRGEVPLLVSV